ncbi:general odorant-binding protein 19d-like [Bombus fervidus]|uniref:general odorant-binding protein 19d-like n=1 Tax=Bombus fervidus TaxID=203811 RepID=UPI003AB2DC72
MRVSLAICCLFFVAGAICDDVGKDIIEALKEDIVPCLAEAEISQDQVEKFIDNDLEGEERIKWGCVKACVMKRMNIMTDGQIQIDNLKEVIDKKLSKEFDSTAEGIERIKKCAEEAAGKTDECDVAFEFSRCMTPA